MVTTSGEREAILPMISDCACAENPKPPCSLEMSMPRKPCFLTKSQISSGTSHSVWRTCQPSMMRHSSSVGPSRKACSSGVSTMGAMDLSLSQSGSPENSSASKPTVPASSACASVSETVGSVPRTSLKAGAISAARRTCGMASAAKAAAKTHSSNPKIPIDPWIADCQTIAATASPAAHSHNGDLYMPSAMTPASTAKQKRTSTILQVPPRAQKLNAPLNFETS